MARYEWKHKKRRGGFFIRRYFVVGRGIIEASSHDKAKWETLKAVKESSDERWDNHTWRQRWVTEGDGFFVKYRGEKYDPLEKIELVRLI